MSDAYPAVMPAAEKGGLDGKQATAQVIALLSSMPHGRQFMKTVLGSHRTSTISESGS